MTRRIFEATRSDGVVVKRTTDRGRTYTHAVVVWHDPHPAGAINGRSYPAFAGGFQRNAEWRSRRELAEQLARSYNAMPGRRAEILEAREVSRPAKGTLGEQISKELGKFFG